MFLGISIFGDLLLLAAELAVSRLRFKLSGETVWQVSVTSCDGWVGGVTNLSGVPEGVLAPGLPVQGAP